MGLLQKASYSLMTSWFDNHPVVAHVIRSATEYDKDDPVTIQVNDTQFSVMFLVTHLMGIKMA